MPIDPNIPQCNHIKVNGLRCGSPSLKGRPFCYFHYSVTRPLIRTDLPVLEDAGSVQYSLNRLAEYILEKRIDYKQASLLLWLMQIASANARHARLEPFLKEDMVREHPDDSYFPNSAPQDSVSSGSTGETAGPHAQLASDASTSTQPSSVSSVSSVVKNAFSPESSASLSEGHGFNRAGSKRKIRALAPEVNPVSSVSSVVKKDSSAISASSALKGSPRKPPTRAELDEAAARAIEKFRNTPPIEEVVPVRKRRRNA